MLHANIDIVFSLHAKIKTPFSVDIFSDGHFKQNESISKGTKNARKRNSQEKENMSEVIRILHF